MDTTRIALSMTGAVSLGSYEAGVLTELLWALAQPREGGPRYELDVITGASAGAMTAGLVANLLMNDFSRRENLYRAWVEMVTIDRLLDSPPKNALLSSTPVREIGSTCLSDYDPDSAKRAPFAPAMLRMCLTLSNVNGLDRELKMASGPRFVSTFFDDRKTFRLVDAPGSVGRPADPGAPRSVRDRSTWDLVRDFAIASGSFPLAFPPISLARLLGEYDVPGTILPTGFTSQPTYVDGGTFNNQPIGEAVRLAREADDDNFGQARKYFFVNANANNSAFVDDVTMAETVKAPESLAKRLADIIFAESRTSDWLKAVLVNDQIQWRDSFLEAILEIVKDSTVTDPPALIGKLDKLARTIIEDSRQAADTRVSAQPFDQLLDRSRQRYRERIDAVALNANRRIIVELIVFILDHISDLDERKKIEIYSLSTETRLAGEKLQGFAGFFKEEYRKYNFRRGRTIARDQLLGILGDYPPEQGDSEFQQYKVEPEWERFPDESLRETPRAARVKLRDQTVRRAEDLVNDWFKTGYWVPDFLERQVIGRAAGHLVQSRVNALLEL
jgi:predicted acylesterase/phospholipase RssA